MALVEAAHKVHHGAEVSVPAVAFPFLLTAAVVGGHFAEKGVPVIGDDIRGPIEAEGFEAVFEVITEGFVGDDEWFDGVDGELSAFQIITEPQCVLVDNLTIGGIFGSADKIIPEQFSPFLPTVLEIGFDGDGSEFRCLGMEVDP